MTLKLDFVGRAVHATAIGSQNRNCESVLAHWMLPFRVAKEDSSPPGVRIDLRLLPKLMATQVEQTMPHRHRTWPQELVIKTMTMSLSGRDNGKYFLGA